MHRASPQDIESLGRFAGWLRPAALAAVVLMAVVHLVFYLPSDATQGGILEFELAVSNDGIAKIYFDRGSGFNEADTAQIAVQRGETLIPCRLDLPPGRYRKLRFDYLDSAGSARIAHVRISKPQGQTIRTLKPKEFVPNDQIESAVKEGNELYVSARDGVNDPFLTVTFPRPVQVGLGKKEIIQSDIRRAVLLIVILVAIAAAFEAARRRWPNRAATLRKKAGTMVTARPSATLALVAAFATIVSCYPMVFLGRSLVSPNYDLPMLYNALPSVPGLELDRVEHVHGADIGAVMWAHLPYSATQRLAFARDHTVPLWNRYNSGGVPLLGQGQSMIADPLHLLTLALGGNAWAWDLKYLLARFVFCLGAGWLAWIATRRLGIASVVAFSAAFAGFFTFRVNHVAIFSVCYAPWILVSWAGVARAASLRFATPWIAGWSLANIAVLSSGTVKEATMLIAALNLAGGCFTLFAPATWTTRLVRLGVMAVATTALVMITTPLWLTFRDTLENAFTFSDQPSVWQLPWPWLVGFFDHIFFQQHFPGREIAGPALNVFFLFGLAWFAASVAVFRKHAVAMICFLAMVAALAMSFRVVPAAWILAVPGLRRIGHVNDVFSNVALVLAFVPAACGLARAWDTSAAGRGRPAFAGATCIAVLLLYFYFAEILPTWFGDGSTAQVAEEIVARAYFLLSLALMVAAWSAVPWLARRHAVDGGWSPRLVFAGAAVAVAVLARHGQHVQTPHGAFFFSPAKRPDFTVASPAVAWLTTHAGDPTRVVGVHGNLFPGTSSLYGLEGVNGPDALVSRAYRELMLAEEWAPPGDWYLPTTPEGLAPHRRMLDLLNVRFLLENVSMPPLVDHIEMRADLDLEIFENPDAWPRAFFTDRILVCDTAADLVRTLREGDGRPFAALASNDASAFSPGDGTGFIAAENYRLTANRTSFDVESSGAGVVVLTETFWPGDFQASVDGHPARVLRVNHAFKGVAVDSAGRHRVEFVYWPRHLTLSLWLAAAGLAVLAGCVWWTRASKPGQAQSIPCSNNE